VESSILLHIPKKPNQSKVFPQNMLMQKVHRNFILPHLKHVLCHFSPPAKRSSAAYTDLPHFGHLGLSGGLNGIFTKEPT